MSKARKVVRAGSAAAAFAASALIASAAQAGGLLLYEFGTAEPGLAAAGYAAVRRMHRPRSRTRPE